MSSRLLADVRAVLDQATTAWAGGENPLLYLTAGLAVVGAVRATGLRVVAVAWLVVPLLLLLAAELVRPVYLPRYLLSGLLALHFIWGRKTATPVANWQVACLLTA